MQDTLRWLIQDRFVLGAVFGLGVANVLFAVIFGTLTDRWIVMLLRSPRIKKARKESTFVNSYCRFVQRIPMRFATVIFGFILMVLALVGLTVAS